MFVGTSMTRKVETIGPDANVFEAQEKMIQNKVRHLPVVDEDNRLLGIVTDRDIRSAMPSALFETLECTLEDKNSFCDLTIKDIMTRDPLSISPLYTIQDAMLLIQKERIGALPVVDEEGKLKGIISIRDLLRAFINVMGIGEPGTLLGVLADEKTGELKKIVDIIAEEGLSMGSVLVAKYFEKHKRAVFPYLLAMNVSPVKEKLVAAGFEMIDPLNWYIDRLPGENDEGCQS
ncbi:MAG: CBS domain-containing protein [Desulfobacteraceae bacterium]|nr:CBS domain-containing protein [Desulfobacteraceae bacterium]MBU4002513.1 CBS and ACT domain-containing protein [Pseudomonadota bacterium]MBU4055822.1 CBS and ACT domain-containing protein [Pseudomonadota bacterium]